MKSGKERRPYRRFTITTLLLQALFPASFSRAEEHFLTTTFGNDARCEHRGTLKSDGERIRFDLSALPPSTEVFRAVLRVPSEGHRRGETVRVVPRGLPSARPLSLRAPLYDSFDALAATKRWVKEAASNGGLEIETSGGVDFRTSVLEVSYAGDAAEPLPAVKDLRAFHQSGQTFLTWTEIEDVIGQDRPTFEDFEKAVLEAQKKRRLVYRIYRHDQPITLKTLGRAELVREVPEAISCWNLKAIRNTEHPNQGTPTKRSPLRPGYNLARGDIVERYRVTNRSPTPLPRSTGLAVLTTTVPGERYYAVTAAIDGRERVASLGAGATLERPVDERTSGFPAIIYQRTRSPEFGQRQAPAIDVYNSWIEPPYHNVPATSETFIVRWRDLPAADLRNRLPLFVTLGTYGSTATNLASPGWHQARRHVKGAFTIGLAEGSLWQGFHECLGTLRGYDEGVVYDYPQRRVLSATAWATAKPDFFIDPERVYLWGQLGSWALRHGDVFAVVLSNGYGHPAIGKIPQQHGWKWGPYPRGSRNWRGVDQWEFMNVAKWVRDHPAVELPYWICSPAYGAYPAHTIGDFGFMPWPEMLHAMVSTRRAFAANWSTNGPGPTRPLHDLVPRIRLHQSLPAFTNCSLDHSPGDGDHADAQKGGGINLYPRWDPETIVDEADRWEITIYLSKESPQNEATLDLTPRRCQSFRVRPGEKVEWARTSLPENTKRASGEVVADRWGLVTIEGMEITRDKQRITMVRGPAMEPWVEAMRKVHENFTGVPGTFAHFGDSITVSMAFWTSLRYDRKNMNPELESAYGRASNYMKPECWREWKGPAYGNNGRMTIRWAHENVDTWLEKLRPEVALIMFGTNDLNRVPLEEYERKTREVVQRCLEGGTVVILSTIPPRSRMLEKSGAYAEATRRVAKELNVPLIDYYAECLARRPDDWDGRSDKFKEYSGYDVPTLISRDGVHPSNPKTHRGDYSEEGLRTNGFVLRNYLTLMAYAEVIERVLESSK